MAPLVLLAQGYGTDRCASMELGRLVLPLYRGTLPPTDVVPAMT